MPCNMHPLAITTIARGMWLLPEKTEDIDRWLKFLNLKERLILHDRLKLALESFPEER